MTITPTRADGDCTRDELIAWLRTHAGELRYHEWDEEQEAAQKCDEVACVLQSQAAENERLREECQAQYDRGYYDGRAEQAWREARDAE